MKENPYELLYMFRLGDRYAEKSIYSIYKPFVDMIVRSFLKKHEYLKSYEDDLIQECMISVFVAVKRYRQDKDSAFRTFLTLIVKRKLYLKVRWYQNYLFADGQFVTEWDDDITDSLQRSELTTKYRMYEPEYYLQYRIAEENLLNSFSYMTKQEKQVLALWDKGKTYKQAADTLGCTSKQYETKLRNIRSSLYRSLDPEGYSRKRKKQTFREGKQGK